MALYKSAYADFQVLIRPTVINYHPVTGVEIGRVKALRANFGSHGGEFTVPDPLSGELVTRAIIHGHFFDTESAAERIGWTSEELESVEASLDKLAREQPYLLAKIDLTRPPVAAPWRTYDDTDANQIVQYAISLGFAEEALQYEKENLNRASIVSALEDNLAGKPAKRGPGRPRKVQEDEKEPEVDPAAEALASINLA